MRYASLLAIPAIIIAAPVLAMDAVKFDAAKFQAAQAAGKPILVEVSAPWCPVCKAQKPILSNLLGKPQNKAFAVFEVDFDSQKDALKALNVTKQSTLIVYKGKTEAGRSTGDTNAASIERLVQSGSKI